MANLVDSATRSWMMSRIRGRNTKLEILIRSLLRCHGFRFRLHACDLPSKSDIVLPRYHALIFVHGCFWDGHDCPLFKWLGTRPDFWRDRIGRNCANDYKASEALLAIGWRVGIVWECAIRGGRKNIEGVVQGLADWLRSDTPLIEVRE